MFNSDANFEDSYFNGTANFRRSKFNSDAIFSHSKFKETADFRESEFLEILDLTDVAFNRLLIYWPSIVHLSCNDGATYLALIKNGRESEQYEAADNIYYQYRDWRRDQNVGWSKVSDHFAWLSCGYGVKPERTVIFALFIMVLFGIIYSIKYYQEDSLNMSSFKEAFAFSAVALFSLPKELYPYGEKKYIKLVGRSFRLYLLKIPFRSLVFFERIIGWGLLLLFINTLTRVMIRY
jgi:hypothetical protein